MRRIRIAVIDFIREDIVLILVGRPIIKTEFRPESSVITAEVICAYSRWDSPVKGASRDLLGTSDNHPHC